MLMVQELLVLWWNNKNRINKLATLGSPFFYIIIVRYFLENFLKIDRTFTYFTLNCGFPAQITIILSFLYSRVKATYLSLFNVLCLPKPTARCCLRN